MLFREFEDSSAAAGHARQRIVGDERGTRSTQDRVNDDGFEHVERVAGTFLRRFTLPESAQAEAIKARYGDGVLEITIPKQPRVEPKRITVTVN